MKSKMLMVAVLLAGVLGFALGYFAGANRGFIGGEVRPNPAAAKASDLGKYLSAWALDHGGKFPESMEAFKAETAGMERYGMDPEGWKEIEILEYHGGLSNDDDGRTTLLRMKLKGHPDIEARLTVGGSAMAYKAGTT